MSAPVQKSCSDPSPILTALIAEHRTATAAAIDAMADGNEADYSDASRTRREAFAAVVAFQPITVDDCRRQLACVVRELDDGVEADALDALGTLVGLSPEEREDQYDDPRTGANLRLVLTR